MSSLWGWRHIIVRKQQNIVYMIGKEKKKTTDVIYISSVALTEKGSVSNQHQFETAQH